MAQKHLLLHDLLQEDQEPFYLNTYISDKRIQLNKQLHQFPNPNSQFQFHHLKNQIPISRKPRFPIKFCQKSCFNLPEVQNSPLYEFRSPVKSPCNNSKSILFHIPATTATLLLKASSRVSTEKKKQSTNLSKLGLFGSVLKKIRSKNKNGNRELKSGDDEVIKVKELIDFELSISSCTCKSPSFRLAIETNSVSDIHTPELSSLVSSPSRHNVGVCYFNNFALVSSPTRHNVEQRPNHGDEHESKFQVEELDNVEVDEEEKEQFSPVSVLDPPFEDDVENHSEEEHDDDDDDESDNDENINHNFDLECSYAFVQRAKQQLLQKLRRFEQLAELDPIDLEKRLLDDDDQEESETTEESVSEHDELAKVYKSNNEWIIREVLNKQRFKNTRCISTDMKKLVSDLVLEEKRAHINGIEVVKRVSKRLDSLKQVESNTIDMMVEFDFGKELDGWSRYDQEHFRAIATEFEYDILEELVDELLDELIS